MSGRSYCGVWLAVCVGLFVFSVSLSGCVVQPQRPGACGPHGCAPPATMMCPAVVPQYAEPQWRYFDRAGVPRVMGDTRLRAHLGLLSDAGGVAE